MEFRIWIVGWSIVGDTVLGLEQGGRIVSPFYRELPVMHRRREKFRLVLSPFRKSHGTITAQF